MLRNSRLAGEWARPIATIVFLLAGCANQRPLKDPAPQAPPSEWERLQELVVRRSRRSYYVDMIAGSRDLVFEKIGVPGVQGHDIYNVCVLDKPHPPEFTFAIPQTEQPVLCLTGSTEALSELLRREGIAIESREDAEQWLMQSLALTKHSPGWFVVLRSVEDLVSNDFLEPGKPHEELASIVGPPRLRESKEKDGYTAVVYLILQADLKERTVTLSGDGRVEFRDRLLIEATEWPLGEGFEEVEGDGYAKMIRALRQRLGGSPGVPGVPGT